MNNVNKISLLVGWVVFIVVLIGMGIIFSASYSGWILLLMILVPGMIIAEMSSALAWVITRFLVLGAMADIAMHKIMNQSYA